MQDVISHPQFVHLSVGRLSSTVPVIDDYTIIDGEQPMIVLSDGRIVPMLRVDPNEIVGLVEDGLPYKVHGLGRPRDSSRHSQSPYWPYILLDA